MKNQHTQKLVYCALMIALGTVLSFIKFSGPWLFGGSITLFSMLPIAFIGYVYGKRWGLLTGVVYGILQLVLGMDALRGVNLMTFLGSLILDYALAFGVLGLAGMFRKEGRSHRIAFSAGTCVASILRFVCHFISGFLLWSSIAQDGFAAVTYSFGYNLGYMGPEIIITTIGALLICPLIPYFESRQKNM